MKFNKIKALEILEATPKTLTSLLQNLSDEWVLTNEGGETWSPFDVLGHLIYGEQTDWIPRLKIILFEEDKTFTKFNRFAQFELSKGKTMNDLLVEFSELRKNNLVYLKSLNLSDEQLNLTGIHPELGKVTVSELLSCWAVHDLNHLVQISRTMAKQYDEAVGPWKQYLSILK